jgi:hypothetical protein
MPSFSTHRETHTPCLFLFWESSLVVQILQRSSNSSAKDANHGDLLPTFCDWNYAFKVFVQAWPSSLCCSLQEYARRGIIPRAVHRLFQEKEEKPEAGITVQMSYLEVYNEVCDKWSCTLTPICTENIQKQTIITKSSWSLTWIVCTTISGSHTQPLIVLALSQ